MNVRTFRALAFLTFSFAVAATLLATPRLHAPSPARFGLPALRHGLSVAGLGEAALRAVERSAFRLSPSAEMSSRGSASANPDMLPVAPPAVRVNGIIGPPWRALVESEALGRGTHILAAGERVGVFHVDSVTRERLWLASADTSWSIPLEVPWK